MISRQLPYCQNYDPFDEYRRFPYLGADFVYGTGTFDFRLGQFFFGPKKSKKW